MHQKMCFGNTVKSKDRKNIFISSSGVLLQNLIQKYINLHETTERLQGQKVIVVVTGHLITECRIS